MLHLFAHLTLIHLAAGPIFADAWTDGLGKVKTIYTEIAPYLIGVVWFTTGINSWMSHHLVKQHLAAAGLASVILAGADGIASTLH